MERKKKILIVFTAAMEIGGVEQSLLGLLSALDYERYDVDLFLYGHHGPWFSLLDPRVNLLPEVKELAYLRESFMTKLRHGCFYSATYRLLDRIKSIFGVADHDKTWAKITKKCFPNLKTTYDIALGFFLPFDVISQKACAKCRVGWVHSDYSCEFNSDTDRQYILQEYNKVDKIAAVSKQSASIAARILPQYRDKIMVIENILPKTLIEKRANEFSVQSDMPDDSSIKILSLGRFCEAKNFDNVPEICKKLREKGLNIKWYLIGYGGTEPLIRQKITELGMEEYVIVLGKKENPYPYIKACDVYVQPSRYEGKSVAVREAQMLGKPVIITNYATASSQLEDGVDGVIVPLDNDGCAEGIADVLRDPEKLQSLSENCRLRDYSNQSEVEKIYALIDKI